MSTTWGPTNYNTNGSCLSGNWDGSDLWLCGNLGGNVMHGGSSFLYNGATIVKADTIEKVYVEGHPASNKTIKLAVRLQTGNWAVWGAGNKPSTASWAVANAVSETAFAFGTDYFGEGQARAINLAADLAIAIDADAGDQLENGDYINICLWSEEDTSGDYTGFSGASGADPETLTIEWTAAAGGSIVPQMMMHYSRLRRV